MEPKLDVQRLAWENGILSIIDSESGAQLNRAKVCTCGSGEAGWGLHHNTCPVLRYYVEDPAQRPALLKELLAVHAPGIKLEQPRHQLSFQVVVWIESNESGNELLDIVSMEAVLQQFSKAGNVDVKGLARLVNLVVNNSATVQVESIDINWADDVE